MQDEAVRHEVIRLLKVPPSRVTVVRHAIDLDRCKPIPDERRREVRRALNVGPDEWLLLAIGAGGMAVTEIGIFSGVLPDALRLGLAFLFGIAGGLIPASALAAAPVYAPTSALVGTMGGLMVMGSNTGQLFGPPALAAAREAAGSWDGTVWLLLSLALAGVVVAVLSRPMERRAGRY